MSVTLVSRIMLNIRNPRLFGNVVSTVTRNAHSRRPPFCSTARNTNISPFIASPGDFGRGSDSQLTTEPDVPSKGRPKGPGRNKQSWYELDADWAGVKDGRGDCDAFSGVDVSSKGLIIVFKRKAYRFFVVERHQPVISQGSARLYAKVLYIVRLRLFII